MDTNKFVKAIKLLIKEEVKKQVAKQTMAIKESLLKEAITPKQAISRKTKSKPNTAMFKENKFSDLLNETANDAQWRNMSGTPNGMFGADMAQAFGGNGQVNTSMIPQTDSDGRTTDMQKVVDSGVADALTRDYSGLMKAINKKKSGLL